MKPASCAFVHLEEYARSPAKQFGSRGKAAGAGGDRPRYTVADIIGEAERHPDHCRHVADPRPPRILLGVSPREVEAEAYGNAARGTDRLGRKVRSDAA